MSRKFYPRLFRVYVYINIKPRMFYYNAAIHWVFFTLDYIGCYHDDKEKGRDLPFRPQTRTHNRGDALSCVLNCAESGFIYAGVQNGNLCFCGNKYGRYGRASDSHCNLKCLKPVGVQKQTEADNIFNSCGGKWVNSIYSGKQDIPFQFPFIIALVSLYPASRASFSLLAG